jgi:arsenate reductase
MEPQQPKKRILFLSKHNSARSQMAEALLLDFSEGKVDAVSAGPEPTTINDYAVLSMQEVGIDISHKHPKPMEFFAGQHFDIVVSLCAQASEQCPTFPGAPKSLVWNFANPASSGGSDEEKLRAFRDFRDALTQKVHELLTQL